MEESHVLRPTFQSKLLALSEDLAKTGTLVADGMKLATEALLETDAAKAARVMAQESEVDRLTALIEEHCFDLVALQQPVASDLRIVIGALRISASIERMGDLVEHIAKLATMRFPEQVVPEALTETFRTMGRLGESMTRQTVAIIGSRDISGVENIEMEDSQVDELHKSIFTALDAPDLALPPATVVDVTLLSRYYERYADHAVSVTRRVVSMVTAEPYVSVSLSQD